MRYCKHTQWLGLATNDSDTFLQSTDRLLTLLEDLPDPDAQSPSLLVVIGNKSKARAIKELAKTFSPPPRYGRDPSCRSQHEDELNSRSQANLNGRRAHGEIHLHIHAPSAFSSRPILLAEGDLPSVDKIKGVLVAEKCHESSSRQLDATSVSASADKIYFRLLSPFTDIFCFFTEDVGQFKPIVQRLALWLDLGQPSTLPRSTHPKILVVTERRDEIEGDDESDLRVFKRMLCKETTMDVSEQFSEIRVLSLAPSKKNLSNKARHRELFEHLLNFLDQVREARINTHTLFSAYHFAAFFNYALDHVAATSIEPFNFITTSRIKNPVRTSLQEHLTNFLRNIAAPKKLLEFAIPIIASSFLLNSYPPDMYKARNSTVLWPATSWKLESDNQHLEASQQPSGPQTRPQRPLSQRPTAQQRLQTYRHTPPSLSEIAFQLNEMNRRFDDITASLDNLRSTAEETKAVVKGSLDRMLSNQERMEVFGRAVLKQVSQPSNPQPINGSPSQSQASNNRPPFNQHISQQQMPNSGQTSYTQGAFGAGPNPAQPSSSTSYAPPPPPGPESYTEPGFAEYGLFSDYLGDG